MMWLSLIIRILLICGVAGAADSGKTKKAARNGRLSMYFKFKDHFRKQAAKSDDVSLQFTRETNLYSRAAQGYVQIIGRRINAIGKQRSRYARFLVESDNFGRVRFKGVHSGRYLCMNKNGRLIAKADRRRRTKRSRKDRKERNRRKFGKVKLMQRCVFKEVFGKNAYIAYTLAANSSWFLAFDKTGHHRSGRNARAGTKGTQFIERPIGVKRDEYGISERSRPKIYRRKNKRSKRMHSYQKSERSWPLLPNNDVITDQVVSKYIKQFQNRKTSLRRAIKSLIKLKKKLSAAKKETNSKARTKKLLRYGTDLQNIISRLAKNVN